MRRVTSFCRICSAFCGVQVDVDGDRLVRVTGDPDHPITRGYTCPKGRAGIALHHHPDRLDHPLAAGPDGDLSRVEWPAVLDRVAASLRRAIDAHGPHAVGVYWASGWGFDAGGTMASMAFVRTLGTGQVYSALSIDTPSRFVVPPLMFGDLGAGLCAKAIPDVESADLVFYIGQNPVVSHGHCASLPDAIVRLKGMRAQGARIVVADPRTSETAHHADVHVPLRPGSDPALLAFLVREVLHRGADHPYLAECTDLTTLDALAVVVEPYTASFAAARCGVPTQTLLEVGELVREVERLAITTGTGVSMSSCATVTEWLGWALLLVSGSLDRPGGCVLNPGVLRPVDQGFTPFPPYGDFTVPTRPELPRILGELPTVALADEILAGNIRCLLVVGGNPALVVPDSEKVRGAFEQLDELVAIDIVHTETTRLASVVLPAAGQYERGDLSAPQTQPRAFVQRTAAVVAPAHERKPLWWIFGELGRRLELPMFGLGNQLVADRFAAGELDDDTLIETMTTSARVPWSEIVESPHGVVADAPAPGWCIPALLTQRVDLAPVPLVEQFDAWANEVVADELVLIPRRTARQQNTQLRDTYANLELAASRIMVHPLDAAAAGVEDGDLVSVASAHGECSATVQVTNHIRRGVVSMPVSIAGVNQLASDTTEVNELSGMPRYAGIPVTVGPVTSERVATPTPDR